MKPLFLFLIACSTSLSLFGQGYHTLHIKNLFATSTSKLDQTGLVAFFNEERGFVKLDYNILGRSTRYVLHATPLGYQNNLLPFINP